LSDQSTPADKSGESGGNEATNGAPRGRGHEAELRRLEEELAQLGREAMEQGGLRDPGDYAEFLARREYLEERIHILRQMDALGRPRPSSEGAGVGVGQRVTIKTEDGAEETWQIVSQAAARPRDGLISDRSPLGRALLNRRAGDVVDVPSPEGSYKVTVLKVEALA
jgi:transcription elongation GreA/GreB family factor